MKKAITRMWNKVKLAKVIKLRLDDIEIDGLAKYKRVTIQIL